MSDAVPTVIVKINGGEYVGCIYSGDVRVLIIDDGCTRDRVYQLSFASTPDDIAAVIGDSPIGHADDGLLSENEVQGIRAMAARLDGKGLQIVKGDGEE